MSEIITQPLYSQQYYRCRLCGEVQIFVLSVTVGPGSRAVIQADEESIEQLELWKYRDWGCDLRAVPVPGKRELLCNYCWAHRREEAVAKELMA